jgi:hypothetical protein
LRTISPAATGGRRSRLTGGFGPDLTGRPRKRTIAVGLGFPEVFRCFVDIATPTLRITASAVVG